MNDAPKFTLVDGLLVVKEFELALAPLGWHCALGGGLIYKGHSAKDIDIIAYPHHSENPTKLNVATFARGLGFPSPFRWNHYKDAKREVWILRKPPFNNHPHGLRVDLIVRP